MNKNMYMTLIVIVLLIGVVAAAFYLNKTNKPAADVSKESTSPVSTKLPSPAENKVMMDPAKIDPARFTTKIDNKYFSLPVGRTLTYKGKTQDGEEKIVITIPGETKVVAGVKTLVYVDKVWIDNELVEDTKDYLAQDDMGNVWYFGEDVNNYEDGKLKDHDGTWLAGVDGALPGIWIKAAHVKGDSYKQEYYKGKAEDMRDVVSVGEPVTIGIGSYKDCVRMYDWSPLDKELKEHKDYCAEVGAMVLETDLVTGDKIELVEVK